MVDRVKFFRALGRRVKELRQGRGYSQEDMIAFGFSCRHWQQIEAGRPITMTTLLRICDAFTVRIAGVVRGTEKTIATTYDNKRGRLAFVSPCKLEKSFRQILSFSEEMNARGLRPGSKVLSFEIVPPPRQVIEALHLAPRERTIRLQRVRMVDSFPMGVECSFLWERLFPDLLRRFDPSGSLYRALADVYGMQVAVVEEVAEVGAATPGQAQLLRTTEGSPIFIFRRISYIYSGQPVEYVESYYRGDQFKICHLLRQ